MATPFDLATVDRLLTTTRSVRRRLDLTKPVPEDVILECVELAIQAPTGSNMQTWRWMVVTDEAKRKEVGTIYERAIDRYHAFWDGALPPDDAKVRKVLKSSIYLAENLKQVPTLVIPCAVGKPEQAGDLFAQMGYGEGGWSNHVASGFYGSVWPAVWSLMLALRSRGLASTLTTMHLAAEKEVADVLGIPEHVTQIGLIPVAYFKGEDFKAAPRRPAREITYFNAWKNLKDSGPS